MTHTVVVAVSLSKLYVACLPNGCIARSATLLTGPLLQARVDPNRLPTWRKQNDEFIKQARQSRIAYDTLVQELKTERDHAKDYQQAFAVASREAEETRERYAIRVSGVS